MENKTVLTKDLENKKITVKRSFNAPISNVWIAWTDSKLLDLWWAPKPYKAETKLMDFREGGFWLYAMVSPDGEKQWCRFDYKSITNEKNYSGMDAFCDEDGKPSGAVPSMTWNNTFTNDGETTKVTCEITFDKIEDLKTILEMGFEEGFTAANGNLDELLASQK